MTAYIDQQGMIDRFGEAEILRLTDRARTGSIDTQVLQQAITDAQSEVDAYVGSRYSTPLAVVTDAVRRTTADIARYRLYDDRCPENVRERYREAVQFLVAVSNGKATLGNDDQGATASLTGASIETARTSNDRVFSLDKLRDF